MHGEGEVAEEEGQGDAIQPMDVAFKTTGTFHRPSATGRGKGMAKKEQKAVTYQNILKTCRDHQ